MTSRPARTPMLLVASLAAGLGYPLVWDIGLAPSALIALKGAGVGLLAVLAAMRARSGDGWLLAAVMALGALGDILLELRFEAGVAAFGLGHVTAIALYRRNCRPAPTASQRLLAAGLLLFGAVMPFVLLGRTTRKSWVWRLIRCF